MKKIYTLLGSVLVAGGALAQSPFAVTTFVEKFDGGKHDGKCTFIDNRAEMEGHFDRATYYSEDFESGLGGWTNNILLGAVGFESTTVGLANNAGSTFIIPDLLSSTPANWIMVDSDALGSGGSEELATFTSPVIDLTASGYTGGDLKFEMEQYYAGWALDTCKLAVSDDAGSTWDVVEIANNGLGRESRPNPELVSIDISSYIVDPTQVQLQLIWHANWDYGWQFDNIQILDLPANDLELSRVFRDDYVNGFSYSMMPDEQAREFVIGVRIENIGANTMTNVGFNWDIIDPSASSAASGTSTTIATSLKGQIDTIWVSTGFTPTDIGNYDIDFDIFSDYGATDDDPTNDAMTDSYFELTDYTYGTDYGPSNGKTFYNWVPTPTGAASIGSIMEIFANGEIGAIWSELDDSPDVVDQVIYYSLYKFDGAAWAWEGQTDDYTTVTTDQGSEVILYFDSPIPVVTGDAVIALAGHYGGSPSCGWPLTGDITAGQVAGTDDAGTVIGMPGSWAPKVRMLMLDFTTVDETVLEEEFVVYPNPTSDIVNVGLTLLNSENTTVNVLDISGKVISSRFLGDVNGKQNVKLDVTDFSTGVYFIEVVNSVGTQNKKFIKR